MSGRQTIRERGKKCHHFIITDGVYWSRIGDRYWDPDIFKADPRIIVHVHSFNDMLDMEVVKVVANESLGTYCLMVKSLCSKTTQLQREVLKATKTKPIHIKIHDVSLPLLKQAAPP